MITLVSSLEQIPKPIPKKSPLIPIYDNNGVSLQSHN